MLTKLQQAPAFSVANEQGETTSLSGFLGDKKVVLYFYPKDDTPGCTIEANQFTALSQEFKAANTVVLGVSKDDCASHQAFIKKFNLSVSLLADTSGELCETYQVWQEKEKNGVKKMGIVRSTFVIDTDGVLQYVEYGVSPEGHAQAILDLVTSI